MEKNGKRDVLKMEIDIKKRLNTLLNYVDIAEEDLYYMVGYRCIDVNTKEDFNEVVRLLSRDFYGLDRFYID